MQQYKRLHFLNKFKGEKTTTVIYRNYAMHKFFICFKHIINSNMMVCAHFAQNAHFTLFQIQPINSVLRHYMHNFHEYSFIFTFLGKTRTKEKYRVVYTDHQRLELEKEFHFNRYITIRRKSELAVNLGLSERQVQLLPFRFSIIEEDLSN